ncbi:MAG: ABC transporter permease, partial [Caldilineaceae bacterium]|nr:ABC transporter permease [Caldilineaceae bacterium]
MSAAVSTVTKRRSNFLGILRGSPIIGPLAALIIASIFFANQTDRFLTGSNLSLVLQQVVVVGTLAIGQTLVILTAGIDLSNGAVMALGGVIMTSLAAQQGINPFLAILIGISVCLLIGALNGALVTGIRLPAFIITFGFFFNDT